MNKGGGLYDSLKHILQSEEQVTISVFMLQDTP